MSHFLLCFTTSHHQLLLHHFLTIRQPFVNHSLTIKADRKWWITPSINHRLFAIIINHYLATNHRWQEIESHLLTSPSPMMSDSSAKPQRIRPRSILHRRLALHGVSMCWAKGGHGCPIQQTKQQLIDGFKWVTDLFIKEMVVACRYATFNHTILGFTKKIPRFRSARFRSAGFWCRFKIHKKDLKIQKNI